MLRSLARRFKLAVEQYLPDSFVFAVLLTFLTFIMGIVITRQTPFQMVQHWYGGFWAFLAFGMQMVLILLTGYALAMAPAVQRLLGRVAQIPRTPRAAVIMAVVVGAVGGYISWGFGFVLGPIFARELARRVEVDYPILIAGSYAGAMAALPAGLTVTAPILVNTPGHFLEEQIGLIPLGETIFGPVLLSTTILAVLGMIWAFAAMLPRKEEQILASETALETAAATAPEPVAQPTVAMRLNHSKLINYLLVVGGFVWIIHWFATRGFDLTLDIMNFTFLFLGLALHGTPQRYIDTLTAGARSAVGIVLQFPFYAGIMGMMSGSGLVVVIAQWMVSLASTGTFGFISFLSAGLVNIFVPSAGGQWGVQGPILVEAARQIGVPVSVAINAFTIGDLWTNLAQPFFALPALGISGLGLKDIWGYCLVALIVYFFAATIGTLVVPLLF